MERDVEQACHEFLAEGGRMKAYRNPSGVWKYAVKGPKRRWRSPEKIDVTEEFWRDNYDSRRDKVVVSGLDKVRGRRDEPHGHGAYRRR